MEHINAPTPDWIAGSLHGTHGDTTQHYPTPPDPAFSAADWHIYGMIWTKAKIAFYVDLGFKDLVFHFPGEDQTRQMDQFAADVLPRLRERWG